MPHNSVTVCPDCGTRNRVAGDKPPQDARCGKCRQRLFRGKPVSLDTARFDGFVTGGDIPVLVDFWAPWCGPCKSMAPAFEAAAAALEPLVLLAKVNTEDEQKLASRFGIQSIPTLVLFRSGREAARMSGAMNEGQLVAWTKQQLGLP